MWSPEIQYTLSYVSERMNSKIHQDWDRKSSLKLNDPSFLVFVVRGPARFLVSLRAAFIHSTHIWKLNWLFTVSNRPGSSRGSLILPGPARPSEAFSTLWSQKPRSMVVSPHSIPVSVALTGGAQGNETGLPAWIWFHVWIIWILCPLSRKLLADLSLKSLQGKHFPSWEII